ncbi:hypothetical protein A3A39_03460 [Candidatus Kaiserbacteria bacterium RIFCSPLOWO2_01_FULL_54_13]|uniref:YcaO domain-containing protein n=1 Tax=Candidatus Kaiserbacteria bacterium RIFCSPLOWO2_01_FULL_54_13 TaxID=1798512 RepID=A0A1F6F350_9BACT|nr:MAG: hypothetical protein A3A39_03460 [Candidatus Kaiserbacteria bacterium RIFCSPLOWO2_01_FULL_54_13]
MLRDVLPFLSLLKQASRDSLSRRAIFAFVDFLERKWGVQVVYPAEHVPFGRSDLIDAFEVARTLKGHGVITEFNPVPNQPDEPPLHYWSVICNDAMKHRAGGMSAKHDRDALLAALAEALERLVWFQETDYFLSPVNAKAEEISKRGAYIAPERFAGFSARQREHNAALTLEKDTSYLWIRALSLTNAEPVYVPAQIVSNAHFARARKSGSAQGEPVIRVSITTGLATWPTRTQAVLSGALEVIERDAFMITWLNQLSLPRIDLSAVIAQSLSLQELLARCARYRLKIEAIQLITDAPAHAVCAVVEDPTGHAPRFAVGLKAHRNLAHAVEEAILEALRGRRGARSMQKNPPQNWRPEKTTPEIGHRDRLLYWMQGEQHKELEFLVAGPVETPAEATWESDTSEEHLSRIVNWCKKKRYEFASVDLGRSKRNPLPWSIEMVVIPELHPMHQNERFQYLDSARLREVPALFGYDARTEAFSVHPQPFS